MDVHDAQLPPGSRSDRLFYAAGSGGDLGYHELTDAADGFLRHELLFATGATVTFEFREVEVTREPWRADSLRPPADRQAPRAPLCRFASRPAA